MQASARSSFTLIELLLVIGIIFILISIIFVAVTPARQLGDAHDVQRRQDVTNILSAVYQYAFDNQGNLPPGIPTGTPKMICQQDIESSACTGAPFYGVDLKILVGSHISSLPRDPNIAATGTGTLYTIVQDLNGRITVAAPGAERTDEIKAVR